MDALVSPAAFFWSWVVPLSVQGVVLLSLAAIVDRLLPRRVWPEVRLAGLSALLVKFLLPPGLASVIPLATLMGAPLPDLAAALRFSAAAGQLRVLALVAAGVWAAGLVVGLLVTWRRSRRLEAMWAGAAPPPPDLEAIRLGVGRRLGLRTPPEVRCLSELTSPFVFGVFRPRIVLPADIDPDSAAYALTHEFVHVRRHDTRIAGLVGLVRWLYWFHPLVHLAARRHSDLREICCDRAVGRHLGRATAAYRRTLLEFASRRHFRALGGLSFVGGSCLLARLAALDSLEPDRPVLRRAVALGVVLVLFGCAAPVAPTVDFRAHELAEMILRPPGCLQLRYLVMGRLAEERRRQESQQNRHH